MTDEEMMRQEQGEITVDELEDGLTAEAEQEIAEDGAQEESELVASVREGIAELFEDGWTAQELLAFSQDEGARRAIADGHSVARAACAYLRAQAAHSVVARKRGVPTVRRASAGADGGESRIEHMTDEQFDAFSRRAKEAMMAGRKVRL